MISLRGWLLLVLMSIFVGKAHPAITALATQDNGIYRYEYVVDNQSGSFPIFAWSLEFALTPASLDWDRRDKAAGGDVNVVGDPAAGTSWGADAGSITTLLSTQDFFALDPLGRGDVVVGDSLGPFVIESRIAPGSVVYYEFGPSGESVMGTTQGPALIPEPSSVACLLVALPLMLRRRRL